MRRRHATERGPDRAQRIRHSGSMDMIVLDLKGGSLNSADLSGLTSLVTVALSEYASLEVVSGADVREMLALGLPRS